MPSSFGNFWRQIRHDVLDLLLPPLCHLCDAPALPAYHRILCEACATDWPVVPPGCERCGEPWPLETLLAPEQPPPRVCARCEQAPPPYQVARALTLYQGRIPSVVHGFKYLGRREVADFAGQRMAEGFPTLFPELAYDAVVPIPLHWRRRFSRGYNQAERLAAPLAQALNLPLELGVRRRESTRRQARLNSQERQENTREAFEVPAAVLPRLQGARLLLIDDVFTTGATVSACVQVLLMAGAARVDVYTLARTPMNPL